MSDCPSAEQLACLVEGRLAAADRDGVQRHVGECEACCALLASLAEADDDDDRPQLARGLALGRYVLLDRIGRGGMGVVWSAYDPQLDRRVAIKLLASQGDSDTSRGSARLLREAQSMARLSHANVVAVHDVGLLGDQVFIAMEFIEGETLRQWLDRGDAAGGWPHSEIVARFVAAGRGLADAHAHGIIHRDFKPDNVLCGARGRVCVTDFGLARTQARVDVTGDNDDADLHRLTRTGAFVGTPAYMAPEQFRGEDSDARSDQFAFCVALWEALFGMRPFAGKSLAELAAAVTSGTVRERPNGARVPAAIERALRRGIAVDPAQRWPDMASLLAVLSRDRLAVRRNVAAGTFALAAVGASTWWAASPDASAMPCTGAADHLLGVWDDDRREAVATALRSTGVSYAETAIDGVSARLDEHAADWIAMHTDACEATTVRGEQSAALLDLRMACLERRRSELDALVEVLVHADATAAEHSVQAATSLPPVSACADVEALSAELPPPAEPERAAAVQRVRTTLVAARARGSAGALQEAAAATNEVVEAAEAIAFPPLLAEALLARGRLRRVLGEYDPARDDLQRAWELALESGHDRVAATAGAERVVLETKGFEWDVASSWAADAIAFSRRVGRDGEPEADALSAVGLLRLHRGEFAEAELQLAAALAIRERLFRPDDIRVAENVGRIADLAAILQDNERAITLYGRAIATMESQLGVDHPMLVAPVLNLGSVYYRMNDLEHADPQFHRALAIHEKNHPTPHPDLVSILTNVGNLELSRKNFQAALDDYERAHRIAVDLFGPDHPQVGIALANVGIVRYELADYEGSRQAFARTLELWEGDIANNPSLAHPLTGLGNTLVKLGRPREALPHLERALVIREQSPASPIERSDVEFALARALFDSRGNRDRALRLARSARERLVAAGETESETLGLIDTFLANALAAR